MILRMLAVLFLATGAAHADCDLWLLENEFKNAIEAGVAAKILKPKVFAEIAASSSPFIPVIEEEAVHSNILIQEHIESLRVDDELKEKWEIIRQYFAAKFEASQKDAKIVADAKRETRPIMAPRELQRISVRVEHASHNTVLSGAKGES